MKRLVIMLCIMLCAIVMLCTGALAVRNVLEYTVGDSSYDQLSKQISQAAPANTQSAMEADAPEQNTGTPPQSLEKQGALDSAAMIPQPSPTPTNPPIPASVADVSIDFSSLKAINPDITAWIVAPGTVIQYPVAHGRDNSYYLTHLYNGKRNANGTIFIDCDNSPNFSDDNTILYGHHMKSGKMFASLEGYKRQSYYDQHPCVYLFTADGAYEVQLFAGIVQDGREGSLIKKFADQKDMESTISKWRSESTFKSETTVLEGDRLVSLATCTYDYHNARFFVIGKLVKIGRWAASNPT